MTSFKKPKVYFGEGGFTGVGKIGKSPVVGVRKPMVYGGGVSASKVLSGGGISRGGVIGLTPSPKVVSGLMREFPRQKLVNAAEFERAAKGFGYKIPSEVEPLPEKRLEEFSKAMAEKEMEFIEADAKAEKPGEAEVRKNMMEMAREPNEESGEVPTVEVTIKELPKYTGFSKGEWGTGSVPTPERPFGGNGGKKKRRRRRRH
jgi:hypothetical protein